MQAAVGGAVETIPGQYITKTEEGFSFSPGEGAEPILVQDPNNLLEINEEGLVVDNDYQVEEGEEGGLIITGVAGGEESAPGSAPAPGPAPGGGMGVPQGGM